MDLIINSLKTVSYAIVDPLHLLILIALGISFYFKNKKVSVMQKLILGESINSPLELTFSQLVLGIVAGAIGSVIITMLGINFKENSGIELLFIISILLIMIKPKFICFSYSSAILGGISIVTAIVTNIIGGKAFIDVNILSLMTLVGVLHILEGFLVMIDGGRGTVPVFTTRTDKIVGGFAYNRYWAMPITILILTATTMYSGGTTEIVTPNWWPIINSKDTLALLAGSVMVFMPLYGIVGYNSVTFTKEKKRKPLISGIGILIYGVLLVIVSQIATFGIIGEIVVVIFAPLAHEFMLRVVNKIEETGDDLYISDDEGICVLEVAPTSPAYESGLCIGDKILKINDEVVTSEKQIFSIIRESIFPIKFQVKKCTGEIKDYSIKPREKKIGMLLVPKMVKKEDMLSFHSEDFKKVLEQLKKEK